MFDQEAGESSFSAFLSFDIQVVGPYVSENIIIFRWKQKRKQ